MLAPPLILLAALTSAAPVRSAEPREARAPGPALELAAAAGMGASWLALSLTSNRLARPSCPCDPPRLLPLDRTAVGHHFAHGAQLANAAAALALTDALLLSLTEQDPQLRIDSALQMLEALTAAGLATQAVKLAASRPYPYMYRSSADAFQRASGENFQSFWSGHTAVPLSAVLAAFLSAQSSWRARVLLAVGVAASLAAGALEVSNGYHFPTDVLAGAGAALVIGGAVYAVHRPLE